jgi:hypothetical protein
LRSNDEFAIYYHSGGKPRQDRIDGYWVFENQNSLIFKFNNGVNDVEVTILEYADNTMKILEKNDRVFSLRKQ